MIEKELDLTGWDIEEGNSKTCPYCQSKRVSQINTYQTIEEINISSGRILSLSKERTPYSRVFHSYLCRKCGWQSYTFDE